MPEQPNQDDGATANLLGMVTGLIVGDAGAAVAIIGGLCAAFTCLNTGGLAPDVRWKFYLVAGSLFVSIFAVCRFSRRT